MNYIQPGSTLERSESSESRGRSVDQSTVTRSREGSQTRSRASSRGSSNIKEINPTNRLLKPTQYSINARAQKKTVPESFWGRWSNFFTHANDVPSNSSDLAQNRRRSLSESRPNLLGNPAISTAATYTADRRESINRVRSISAPDDPQSVYSAYLNYQAIQDHPSNQPIDSVQCFCFPWQRRLTLFLYSML